MAHGYSIRLQCGMLLIQAVAVILLNIGFVASSSAQTAGPAMAGTTEAETNKTGVVVIAMLDLDGDGYKDYAEYWAGTDPKNPKDYPAGISAAKANNDPGALKWYEAGWGRPNQKPTSTPPSRGNPALAETEVTSAPSSVMPQVLGASLGLALGAAVIGATGGLSVPDSGGGGSDECAPYRNLSCGNQGDGTSIEMWPVYYKCKCPSNTHGDGTIGDNVTPGGPYTFCFCN